MRTAEWLADKAGAVLMTAAEVTGVDRSIPHFVRVGLRSPSFRGVTWVPGSKVQIRAGAGAFTLRTFTPVRWDVDANETELIGFTHGDGPAAAWFGAVETGASARLFGPRGSIDLAGSASVLFVGDESSVALACALRQVTRAVRHVFEAVDPTSLDVALAALGLAEHVTVVPKTPDRAALLDAARRGADELGEPWDLVASGDAATVHAVRRNVRSWARQPRKLKAKAYWAEGRTGLD